MAMARRTPGATDGIEKSTLIYALQRDYETSPFCLAGSYAEGFCDRRYFWLEFLRPVKPTDWRGFRKAFPMLTRLYPHFYAVIDLGNEKALRFATRLGFVLIEKRDYNLGVFKWQTQQQ